MPASESPFLLFHLPRYAPARRPDAVAPTDVYLLPKKLPIVIAVELPCGRISIAADAEPRLSLRVS